MLGIFYILRRIFPSNQASWRNGSASDSSITWSFLKVMCSNHMEVMFLSPLGAWDSVCFLPLGGRGCVDALVRCGDRIRQGGVTPLRTEDLDPSRP